MGLEQTRDLPRSPARWGPRRQWKEKVRSKRIWVHFVQNTANLNRHPWSWRFEGQVCEPKKKSFQLGEGKGSRRSSALPAGKSLPIYSSLRQGWIRVWTSVSTAVRFPKKTADKNVIWILDRFGKVSALLKKKNTLGTVRDYIQLPHASFHLKEKLPFPFNLFCEFQSFR